MQGSIALEKPAHSYVLRDYQEDAVKAGVDFFRRKSGPNEILVLPTAAGKSLIAAGVVDGLNEPTLILQPSKEILSQNYEKYISYGNSAGIFSASVGRKDIEQVTYASLASIMAKDRAGRQKYLQHFLHYRNIIIDECHLGSDATGGMLKEYLGLLNNPKVLGMTATPFRLYPHTNRDGQRDSMLKMLTRTAPKIFGKIGYHIQIAELKKRGFLAHLKYYPQTKVLDHLFNRKAIKVNSTGADFDEDALRAYYKSTNFNHDVINTINRVNKAGRRCLVFVSFVEDAQFISWTLGQRSATVHGKTPDAERSRIEKDFKAGRLDSVVNVGCWTTGFDDEELSCVIIAKPMRSLATYYQMLGRGMRKPKHMPDKDCWCLDLCANMEIFGKVEDLMVDFNEKGLPLIRGTGGKILTGVPFKEQESFNEGDSAKF